MQYEANSCSDSLIASQLEKYYDCYGNFADINAIIAYLKEEIKDEQDS